MQSGLILALPIVHQTLHLLVFSHDEILDLLRELLEAIYEVTWLICVVDLDKLWHLLGAEP